METQLTEEQIKIDQLTKEALKHAVNYVESGFADELQYQFFHGQVAGLNSVREGLNLPLFDKDQAIIDYWNDKNNYVLESIDDYYDE